MKKIFIEFGWVEQNYSVQNSNLEIFSFEVPTSWNSF